MSRHTSLLALALVGTLSAAQTPRENVAVTPEERESQTDTTFDIEASRRAYEHHYRQIADDRSRSEFDPVEIPVSSIPVSPIPVSPIEDTQSLPLGEGLFFAEETHCDLTRIAATFWGLSPARIQMMQSAADKPDANQSGLSHGYNQQWSHAYLLAAKNLWLWGDADQDFHDNLVGYEGGLEGPEGYQEKSAAEFYSAGDQRTGDWYVGYATHYIADVSLVLHASVPSPKRLDLLTQHFAFEDWIKANAKAGHRLLDTAEADPYYYIVTEPKTSLHNAAHFISYWTGGLGKQVWDAYGASGYPTQAGSGSPELVAATKEMMIRACRYVKGTIKYALDTYDQTLSTY